MDNTKTPRSMLLYGDSLILKPLSKLDKNDMISYLTNEDIAKTYMLPVFDNDHQKEQMFEKLYLLTKNKDKFIYGIYLNDLLIGLINEVDKNEEYIELGYFISPKYWNKGLATEALKTALKELSRLGYKEARCAFFEENKASEKVMIKCGMKKLEKTETINYRNQKLLSIFYGKKL